MNKPKIIQIEGIDGAFKETNSKLLEEYLKNKGYNVLRMSFPNYNNESSIFVRKYLNGEYDIDNQYIVATFFVYDIYNWFNKIKNSADYEKIDFIIFDRYIGSSMIYQTAKLPIEDKKIDFLIKLDELYKTLKLPIPDCTIYLNLPVDLSIKSINARGLKKDIIEKDIEYLKRIHLVGMFVAKLKEWNVIECSNNGIFKTKEEIFNVIKQIIVQFISYKK